MAKLNKTPLTIRAKRGTESQITSYTGYQLSGEFAYATDTNNLYVSNGTTFLAVGGGATPTLQSVTDEGNTTTNSITAQSFIVEGIQNYDMTLRSEENTGVVIESPRGIFINTSRSTYFNTDTDGGSWGDRQWIFGSSRQYSTGGRTYFKIGNLSGYPFLSLNNHDNNEQVRFDSNGNSYINGGNVGIGTTAPQQKLHVDGTIRIGADVDLSRYAGALRTGQNFVLGAPNFEGANLTINAGSTQNAIGVRRPPSGTTSILKVRDYSTQDVYVDIDSDGVADFAGMVKTDTGFEAYRTGARRVFLGGTSINGQLLLDSGGTWDVNLTGGSNKYFANGNFGIGTTAPQQKLHVGGVLMAQNIGGSFERSIGLFPGNYEQTLKYSGTGLVIQNSSNDNDLGAGGGNVVVKLSPYATNDRTTTLSLGNKNQQSLVHTSANGLLTINNATSGDVMAFDLNGNVGIGTTSPSTLLHLRGDSPTLRIEADGANESSIIELVQDGGVTGAAIKYNGASNIEALQFNTGVSDTRMTIKRATGNVGIGTTAPSEKLDVQESTLGNDILNVGYTSNLSQWQGTGTVLKATSTYNATWNAYLPQVGIGTETPEYTLDIRQGGPLEASLNLQGTYAQSPYYRADSYYGTIEINNRGWFRTRRKNGQGGDFIVYTGLEGQTSWNAKFIVTNAGNVGIGTTAPQSKLTIGAQAGTIATLADFRGASDNDFIQVSRTTDTARGVKIFSSGRINASSTHTSEAAYLFNNAGANTTATGDREFFQINGDWSPSSGTSTWAQTLLTPTINTTGTYVGTVRGIYYNPTVTSATGATHRAIETTAGDVIFNGGNVGIGTTAPAQKLDVAGTIKSSGVQTGGVTLTTGYFSQILYATTNASLQSTGNPNIHKHLDGLAINAGATGNIHLFTNGSERIRITDEGRVGIGTTAPLYPLDLVSNGSTNTAMLRVRSTNDLGNIRFASYDGAETLGSLYFQREGAGTGNLRFYTSNANNNQERLRITPTGNVGIGTTAPTEKLHVAGNVKSTSVLLSAYGTELAEQSTRTIIAAQDNRLDILNIARTLFVTSFDRDTGYHSFYGPVANPVSINVSSGTISKLNAYLDLYNNQSGNVRLFNQSTNATFGNVIFGTSDTERMRITSAGNVGIGTTAPDSKLHVKATSGIAFKVDPNDADKEWYIDTTNPDHLKKEGNLILNADPTNVHTSTKISFNIDGSNKASINSDGDLGVGTTAQTSKVHVDGTAMRQLRMGTSGGPSSNTDTSGAIGDMAYDDNYFYIKTINGWGRVPLDFGF